MKNKTGAQGAVPGPQFPDCLSDVREDIEDAINGLNSGWPIQDVIAILRECSESIKLATPEPHSPHVHNFDANGICVTMGCTPAEEQGNHIVQSPEMVEPAAASTDERLAEIAERESKATKGEWIWEDWQQDFGDDKYTLSAPAETRPNGPSDMFPTLRNKIISDDEYEISQEDRDFIAHARADIPYLLRLVAELRRELTQWTKWGVIEVAVRNPQVADYMNHWEARAEQAERERDEARKAIADLKGESISPVAERDELLKQKKGATP